MRKSVSSPLKQIARVLPLGLGLAAAQSCFLLFPYAPDQLSESLVRAECHFFFACCAAGEWDVATGTGLVSDLSRFRSEQECIQERVEEGINMTPWGVPATEIQQAESAGRFKYASADAQACFQPLIDALNQCQVTKILGNERVELPSTCGTIPGQGLVKNEGDCFSDFECGEFPGSQCIDPDLLLDPDDRPDPADGTVINAPGVCLAPLAPGDSCTPDADNPDLPVFCDPGFACLPEDGEFGDPVVCREPYEEGDACPGFGCAEDLLCDAVDAECKGLKRNGVDCADGDECESGFCDTSLAEPECDDLPTIDVRICDGVEGANDPIKQNAEE